MALTENAYYHTHGNNNRFSPTEIYKMKADGYYNQWDNAMANAFKSIADGLWSYSGFANSTVNAADSLLDFVRKNEAWLQWVAWDLYSQLRWDIQEQKDYVNSMFGPNGTLTNEINTYYDDLWNYLATDAGRQAAKIAAQWMHSWASLWAIRAQQNEAYNESFGRYIKAKEQEINAKQQIASNLINYMSTLRQEYWDTTNKYVIELYKRANDLYKTIATSVANDITAYNKLKIQASSSSSTTKGGWITYKQEVDADGNPTWYIIWYNVDWSPATKRMTAKEFETLSSYFNPNTTNNTWYNNLWTWWLTK